MLKSMTGYGRAERQVEGFNIKVNLKSVNHRYIDITVKMPRYYSFAEDKIRQSAMKYISRGKVEVHVSIDRPGSSERTVVLDTEMAKNYINALKSLKAFGLKDDIKISTMAQYGEIFKIESDEADEEHISSIIESVFVSAAEDFVNMRKCEGERMENDICAHLDCLSNYLNEVEQRYPKVIEEYRQKLSKRIADVLADENIDESRILTEAAIYADKSDISEETVRLASHIKEFKDAIKTDKPIGKKLDFIVQEMNRETNTMGSKSGDIEISRLIVDMKSEIEKIREQIQNIE